MTEAGTVRQARGGFAEGLSNRAEECEVQGIEVQVNVYNDFVHGHVLYDFKTMHFRIKTVMQGRNT